RFPLQFLTRPRKRGLVVSGPAIRLAPVLRGPHGRVVMQRTANPRTPVRFRLRPPYKKPPPRRFFCLQIAFVGAAIAAIAVRQDPTSDRGYSRPHRIVAPSDRRSYSEAFAARAGQSARRHHRACAMLGRRHARKESTMGRKQEPPNAPTGREQQPYDGPTGGWGSVKSLARHGLRREVRTTDAAAELLRQNKHDGFMCVSCSWAKPAKPHPFEFCENGAKATFWDLVSDRADAEFF